MTQDLIYALRMLRKRPAFVVFAVLTLALGIGANTVIFSGVYALLLRSLPYPHAERLVVLSQSLAGGVETGVSYADFLDWSAQSREFDGLAAVRNSTVNLTVGNAIERATGSYVSAGLFPLFGARTALGRTTLADEHRAGAARVIVLGYGFWQRRFGGDPAIIGREIRLNDEPMTVVGVLDAEFQYPFRADFWSPLEANDPPETLADRAATQYEVTGRLREGGAVAGAVHELRAIRERRSDDKVLPRREALVQGALLSEALPGLVKYRAPLAALQLAVVFVLLIASVNLANLLLARHTERRQEFAVRLALGAGRARLLRQLLVEASLIGALGAALGLVGANWGLGALRASMGSLASRVPGGLVEVEINAPVLGFTLAVTLLVTLGFGLIPALIASRQDINEWLKSGAANATGDGRRRRWSRRLATAEIALAVMLLAAAGLMIRTFLNLTKEDPGFRPDGAVAISLAPPPSRY